MSHILLTRYGHRCVIVKVEQVFCNLIETFAYHEMVYTRVTGGF
jgi:hypothetical protein